MDRLQVNGIYSMRKSYIIRTCLVLKCVRFVAIMVKHRNLLKF
jgi:hypothetical protein